MDNLAPSQRFDPFAHGMASGYTDLFTPFLGPPPREAKATPYAKKSNAVWNMPESYLTESEVLRDTVEDWMLTANQTWYTERIMPWFKTDDIHIQWEQWENNAHYMGITPHQAPSNVVTQKRNIRRANMVRRGIAAEFEQDFVATARGRTSFIASLAQIGRSVQETANVEVLRSLLGCHTYQQVYLRKFGVIKPGDLDGWLNHKASRFMIAQKETFGLEILNTQIEREQEMYQAQANVWILGREVMDYCSLVPEGKIFYFLGGQEAVDRVNGRGQNGSAAAGTMGNVRSLQPPRMIADTPVYLAKSYFVEGIGALDLLSRTVEVGVFNTMIDTTRDYTTYKSSDRNIRVYDNDRDDWAEIKLEDAIQFCVNWDDKVGDVFDPFTGRQVQAKSGSPQDIENDFLRYGTGFTPSPEQAKYHKQDVAIIGDFDKRWLTRAQCENAGYALLGQLSRTGFGTALQTVIGAKQNEFDISDATKQKNTYAAAYESLTVSGTDTLANIENAIVSILGQDNFFFRSEDDQKKTTDKTIFATVPPTFASFRNSTNFKTFKIAPNTGFAPLASDISGAQPAATVDQEKWHAGYLRTRIGSIVPETHKHQLEKIVTSSGESWQSRAAAIEALCVSLKAEDPQSIASMSDEARIRSWMSARNAEYESGLKQKLASTPKTAAATGGQQQQQQQVQSEVEYFPIGTPLPQGYRYASAHDELKAQGRPKQCPDSLRDFPHLAHIWAEQEIGAAAPTMGGRRRGAGFSPIEARSDRGELGPDGKLDSASSDQKNLREKRLNARFQNLEDRVKDIAQGGAPLIIKMLAILWCGSMMTKERMIHFCTHNVPVPNFLLLRPSGTYRTRYGIKCAANGKSGYTFFGHSNMQLEHEAARKVGMMHYTAYLTAVVTNPKNVYVVEDLFCEKYLGGMGVKFWEHATEYKNSAGRRTRKSIICTMLPYNMADFQLDQKIDIRGRWHTAHEIDLISQERFAQVCYPGGARTALIMGWWEAGRRGKGPGSQVVTRGVDMNYVCWQGVQWAVNPKDGSWGNVIVEQGNFASKVYPTCGQVRNGHYKFLETPAYLATTTMARH
jgi:hypothetical protein